MRPDVQRQQNAPVRRPRWKRVVAYVPVWLWIGASLIVSEESAAGVTVFPKANWESRTPAELGLDASKVDEIAVKLGSSGCIIKDGYLVRTWGPQNKQYDWFSSAKPIFTTLLLCAIHEGRVSSVDENIARWGWPLKGKDRGITFRHLANMTSGYMQPEEPGQAYAHNDFAVALLVSTLEKVFDQSITDAARQRIYHPLGMQDDPHHQAVSQGWKARGRAWISVRDWGRLAWFWTNKGRWNGRQLLPKSYFDEYMRPQVPEDLPYSAGPDLFSNLPGDAVPEDYLGVRSFGGGSNHYNYGAGLYGFHWYFNTSGTVGTLRLEDKREDPNGGRSFEQVWPGLPRDMVVTLGWGINSVMIPGMGLAQVCAGNANWNHPYLDVKGPEVFNYKMIKLLVESGNSPENGKARNETSPAAW